MEWVPSPLATVAAWALTVIFAWAAVAKFIRADAWPRAVTNLGFGGTTARILMMAVPLAELVTVALFALGAAQPAAALTLALIASFSAAIARARVGRKDDRVPCGCFGGDGEYDYRLLLARNGALAVLAGLVLLAPRDVSLTPPGGMEILPTGLVVLAGVLLAWMATQTLSSLRRR